MLPSTHLPAPQLLVSCPEGGGRTGGLWTELFAKFRNMIDITVACFVSYTAILEPEPCGGPGGGCPGGGPGDDGLCVGGGGPDGGPGPGGPRGRPLAWSGPAVLPRAVLPLCRVPASRFPHSVLIFRRMRTRRSRTAFRKPAFRFEKETPSRTPVATTCLALCSASQSIKVTKSLLRCPLAEMTGYKKTGLLCVSSI